MAIKRVWIEEDCIACGTCEGICPEVFTVTDRSRVNEGVNFDDFEAGIKEAAEKAKIDLSGMSSTDINLPFITVDDVIKYE